MHVFHHSLSVVQKTNVCEQKISTADSLSILISLKCYVKKSALINIVMNAQIV
jgi:hypothetical protein